MKKNKILLVGMGPRGLNWLNVIQSSKIVELVGICDINKKTKANLKRKIRRNSNLSKINNYSCFDD